MLSLRQMDSIVHNTLLDFKGFDIKRREEGTNIFYDVYDNPEAGIRFLGTYRVWEWHDQSGRSGWLPLDTNDTEIEHIRHKIWQAIIALVIPTNQPNARDTARSSSIDEKNITMEELEERVLAGDKQAIALEEKLAKELQPVLKEIAELITQIVFNPLELAVYEAFIKNNSTAKVLIRKMTLEELKELMPEIVRKQRASPLLLADRPQSENIIADNLGGTITYVRNEQGQTIITAGALNPGYYVELGQGAAIKPESQIRLDHTTGSFQPGLYPPSAKDDIIRVTSETLAGLTGNPDTQTEQGNAAKPKRLMQKHGPRGDTEESLKVLRSIRLEAIANNRPIPKKTAAMDIAKIDRKTWRTHDPELYDNWDIETYK